jgi:nitronate monooxygenase
MDLKGLKSLKIGDLTAKLPIIQGGMGIGISLSSLSSAVANEGGIGIIATAGIGMNEPDFYTNYLEANIKGLRSEIRKARELTKGILGVNIMVALTNFADLVKTAIEEKIDIIFSGAGLPLNLPQYITKGIKTKIVPIVSSARAATIIAKKWTEKYNYLPDAIVVEGPKAGGHLGFKAEMINRYLLLRPGAFIRGPICIDSFSWELRGYRWQHGLSLRMNAMHRINLNRLMLIQAKRTW